MQTQRSRGWGCREGDTGAGQTRQLRYGTGEGKMDGWGRRQGCRFVNAALGNDRRLVVAVAMQLLVAPIIRATTDRIMVFRRSLTGMFAVILEMMCKLQGEMGATNKVPTCHHVQESQKEDCVSNETRIAIHGNIRKNELDDR